MERQLICFCHGVTEEEIRQSIRNGAHTVEAVQAATQASTGCGGCFSEVERILADELQKLGKKMP
jgi:NAD(P)H-nitrite reductase large subunit